MLDRSGHGARKLPYGGEEDQLRLRNNVWSLGLSNQFGKGKSVVQPEKTNMLILDHWKMTLTLVPIMEFSRTQSYSFTVILQWQTILFVTYVFIITRQSSLIQNSQILCNTCITIFWYLQDWHKDTKYEFQLCGVFHDILHKVCLDQVKDHTNNGGIWLLLTWTFFLEQVAEVAKLAEAEEVLDKPRTIEAALRNGLPNILNYDLSNLLKLLKLKDLTLKGQFQSNDHEENKQQILMKETCQFYCLLWKSWHIW